MKSPGRIEIKEELKVIGNVNPKKEEKIIMVGELPEVYRYTDSDILIMEYQAKTWGFPDHCVATHSATSLNDLEKMERWQIEDYCEFMGMGELRKIETYKSFLYAVLQRKYKFFETYKYHEYIEMNLFKAYKVEDRLLNDLTELNLLYYELPYKDKILDNGFDYYYLRIGSLSVNSLTSYFNRDELMIFLVPLILASKKPFSLHAFLTDDEIAMNIVLLAQECRYDVRNLLGPNMVWEVHNKDSNNLPLLKYDVPWNEKDLTTAFYEEGLRGDLYDIQQMYAEYSLNMLCKPNFCRRISIGVFNIEGDSVKRYVNNVVEGDNVVYYGIRTGEHKYQMMSEDMLLESFRNNGSFINPIDKKIFPRYAMRRLRDIATNESLIDIINELLGKDITVMPKRPLNIEIDAIISLYNFASITSDWEALISNHPLDKSFKALTTLSVGPEIVGNLNEELFKNIILTMNEIKKGNLGDLQVMKVLKDKLVVSSDTIMSYFRYFIILNKYGMQRMVTILSSYLMHSWVWYFRIKSYYTEEKIEL